MSAFATHAIATPRGMTTAKFGSSPRCFLEIRSSPQNETSRRLTLLPTHALQFRVIVFSLRIAETEISDEAPVCRNVQNR